jgi:ethanolamine ammonia-lyase large subunit
MELTASTEVGEHLTEIGKHVQNELSELTDGHAAELKRVQWAIIPEIAAAIAKIMSNKDLILAGAKIRNVTRCRNTMGESGVARKIQRWPPRLLISTTSTGLWDASW